MSKGSPGYLKCHVDCTTQIQVPARKEFTFLSETFLSFKRAERVECHLFARRSHLQALQAGIEVRCMTNFVFFAFKPSEAFLCGFLLFEWTKSLCCFRARGSKRKFQTDVGIRLALFEFTQPADRVWGRVPTRVNPNPACAGPPPCKHSNPGLPHDVAKQTGV